jgi:hypothetical protein
MRVASRRGDFLLEDLLALEVRILVFEQPDQEIEALNLLGDCADTKGVVGFVLIGRRSLELITILAALKPQELPARLKIFKSELADDRIQRAPPKTSKARGNRGAGTVECSTGGTVSLKCRSGCDLNHGTRTSPPLSSFERAGI